MNPYAFSRAAVSPLHARSGPGPGATTIGTLICQPSYLSMLRSDRDAPPANDDEHQADSANLSSMLRPSDLPRDMSNFILPSGKVCTPAPGKASHPLRFPMGVAGVCVAYRGAVYNNHYYYYKGSRGSSFGSSPVPNITLVTMWLLWWLDDSSLETALGVGRSPAALASD